MRIPTISFQPQVLVWLHPPRLGLLAIEEPFSGPEYMFLSSFAVLHMIVRDVQPFSNLFTLSVWNTMGIS